MSLDERKRMAPWRMRSKLFVPASRPDLYAKAQQSGADAVCFDLEDSVLREEKHRARQTLRDFLRSGVATGRCLVRISCPRAPEFAEDLSAAAWPGMFMIAIPKAEDPEEIRRVAAMLAELEVERKISHPLLLLPTIESPRGLRNAAAIGCADARVAGMQVGFVDLLLGLGIGLDHHAAKDVLRFQLRLAAAEAGVPCYDGAFLVIHDDEGLAAEADAARRMGFAGKSCIHPRQIPVIHRVFVSTEAEIARAKRILAAAHKAVRDGKGAFALDGEMVDEPVLRHAEEILRSADEQAADG